MAGHAGRASDSVIRDLFDHPQRFSFSQAIRLLRLYTGKSRSEDFGDFCQDNLRVRAPLTLALPATDLISLEDVTQEVAALEDREENAASSMLPVQPRYRLTATFLGLYGPSSPLPTVYTEELFDEANDDQSVTRDFMDVLGNGYFNDFFRTWAKYRLMSAVIEEQAPEVLTMLYCLSGMGHEELREDRDKSYRMLRYIGLFSQYPRSMDGLEVLLRDFFGTSRVWIVPSVQRTIKIPQDQRYLLGRDIGALGEDAYLGEEIWDRSGAFAIRIEGISSQLYYDILPGSENWDFLHRLIRAYVQSPLEFDLQITLEREDARTVTLGAPQWSGLGYDTWLLGESDTQKPPVAVFPYCEGEMRPLASRSGGYAPS